MTSGIYVISNTVNGNRYIGSAVNIAQRFRTHKSALKNGKHGNSHLQNAVAKYGLDAFLFEILEEVSVELLIEREQFYLDSEQPEYNVCPIAGNTLGRKASAETRRRQSAYHTANPHFLGRKHSEETRQKIRAARAKQVMQPRSQEFKERARAALLGKAIRKGRHNSIEQNIKIAEGHAGRPLTAIEIQRIIDRYNQKYSNI